MKYTPESTKQLVEDYQAGVTVEALAHDFEVPERSIIAKLSSLGVYQKKTYLNKRGEVPTKKSTHIENIATLLDCNLELLESLEKVNKQVLIMIEQNLQAKSDPKSHKI
jgi:Zn-dependent peptidase ImmA (M78 family)